MQKIVISVAALVMTAALALPARAARKNAIVVKSGTVEATVNGKTVVYHEGQAIPAGAQINVTSDAVLEANGTTISAPAGSMFQAAVAPTGAVDVRSNGGQITVKNGGNTAVIPAGGEAQVSRSHIAAISGTLTVTTSAGTQTISAGQGVISGGNTVLPTADVSILPPPPPPNNPKQSLSPSTP